MSISELEHHQEQMEAARAEFQNFWKYQLRLDHPHVFKTWSVAYAVTAERIAWVAFLKGKGLKK